MQTFLPFPNFDACAAVLDGMRLSNQILEAGQILRALQVGPRSPCKECGGRCCVYHHPQDTEPRFHDDEAPLHWCDKCTDGTRPTPWHPHPAVQMWAGYTEALAEYGLACLHDADCRLARAGAPAERIQTLYKDQRVLFTGARHAPLLNYSLPPWLGYDPFHAGHRGHLYRKDYMAYREFSRNARAPLLYPVLMLPIGLVGYAEKVERFGKSSKFLPYPRKEGDRQYGTASQAAEASL